jgi:hypothetical protein
MLVPKFEGFTVDNDELIRCNNQIYIPPNEELRILILNKAHSEVYMAHPRVTKMRAYLKPLFFCKGIKAGIVNYVAKCLEFQQVKTEHINQARLLQRNAIQESKWEVILMDFNVGFLLRTRGTIQFSW